MQKRGLAPSAYAPVREQYTIARCLSPFREGSWNTSEAMQSGMHAGDYRKVARVAGSGRRTAARVLRVVLALLAVSLGNWAIEARAQSGGTTVSTAGAGLSFKIDTRWLDGGGYRPIKVTITPATPTTADRTISIDFVIRGHLLRSERHVFESVEIPAGSAGPMEVCMAIPGMIATPMSSARFLEDGEEIATTYTGGTARNPWAAGDADRQ